MKKINHFIQFIFIYWFILPFKILPFRWSMGYGRFLMFLLYPLAKKQKRIAYKNLKQAFPDKDEAWLNKTTRKSLIHLGNILADAIYGGRRGKHFLRKHVVIDEQSQLVEKKALASGKGIVLIAGHLGIWEMLVWYTGFVIEGGGIYKRLSNSFVDKYYKKTREASGITLFEMNETSKAIRFARKGGNLGFVSDQNAGPDHLFINFMNRKAATFRGPVQISDLAGSHMLFYSAILKKGKVHLSIKDIGVVDREKFPDREKAIEHYTTKWVNILEAMIRENPEQYLWAHQRWKTKPPPE